MQFLTVTNDDNFPMAGTEGTNTYVVPLKSSNGSLGYRPDRDRGVYRVRVEPASAESAARLASAFPASSWKQPGDGGQPRYSIELPIDDQTGLLDVLTKAAAALKQDADWVRGNLDTPDWAYAVATPECEAEERAQLTAQLRRLLVFGVNKRWKLTTLARKVNEARTGMIAEVKRRQLPGANLASTWSTDTLFQKLVVKAASAG